MKIILNKLPATNKNIGAWVRSYHYSSPIFLFVFALLGSKTLAMVSIFLMAIALLSYILLNGCWLSILEKNLCDDDVNIMDLWIELSGNEITKENRKKYTYLIGFICMTSILYVYYYRFILTQN